MLRIIGSVAAGMAVLGGLAFLQARDGAMDPSAAKIPWGGGNATLNATQGRMVRVEAGEYEIGDPSADTPLRRVKTDAFLIDSHEVTNEEFAQFVGATGYQTTAEREGGGWLYVGGSKDWRFVAGANWQRPLGSESDISSATAHPVVLVSWEDAAAYAKWAGKRLATEVEWEVAARAGVEARAGEAADHVPTDANVWQGEWPRKNELTDGFLYTSPAGSFKPNEIGLYDMIGNVWEWTSDRYDDKLRVVKGGSWFCSANYCGAYRPGFRGKSPEGRAFNNVGFRCVKSLGA